MEIYNTEGFKRFKEAGYTTLDWMDTSGDQYKQVGLIFKKQKKEEVWILFHFERKQAGRFGDNKLFLNHKLLTKKEKDMVIQIEKELGWLDA